MEQDPIDGRPPPRPDDYWRPTFELMLAEGRRSIDNQVAELTELRGRATTLIGVAGAIAAFFLSIGQEPPANNAVWLATLAFLFVAGCAVLILYPRAMRFDMNPYEIDLWLELPPSSVEATIRSLALEHWDSRVRNQRILNTKHRAAAIAAGALGVEVATLTLELVFS